VEGRGEAFLTLPQRILRLLAAEEALKARINAEVQAKKVTAEADRRRNSTPSLLTDDELRGRLRASREFRAGIDEINAGLANEMARRGVVALAPQSSASIPGPLSSSCLV
jgi:hypothetical protein